MLLRTFSKVYGLAGLRVGYALCGAEDFRVAVDQVRQPFYLNAAAQAAAVEALRHQDEVERRVTETIAGRLDLIDRVRAVGLWVAESDANFIWLHLPETVEEPDVAGGCASEGCWSVPAPPSAATGRSASPWAPTPENERFARARRGPLRRSRDWLTRFRVGGPVQIQARLGACGGGVVQVPALSTGSRTRLHPSRLRVRPTPGDLARRPARSRRCPSAQPAGPSEAERRKTAPVG